MFRRIGFSVLRIVIGVAIGLTLYNYYNGWVLKSAVSNQNFSTSKQTTHFIVYGTPGLQREVDEYSQFLEGYLSYLKNEYMDFQYDYPIKVYIFPTYESYCEVSKKAKVEGSVGFFSENTKSIYMPIEAGVGTLAHELMHPLMLANLPNQPQWTVEGIPMFFERLYGYWDGGKLYLDVGYQNPRRIKNVKYHLTKLNLKDILQHPLDNQDEIRLASVFLAKNGLLKDYLQLIKQKDKRGFSTYYEAAFQKDFNEIEPAWREYLDKIDSNAGLISNLPYSEIFQNKQDYEQFAKMHNLEQVHKF